ncbi:recombinase family protein [Candidatus Sororendozoicomonas aggregata]|uniref:recombinase family protein n=1 Tax=Candidatus Sororendozoicomonas aggregata TaxID=3073239 RepID=UPI002ED4B82E
MKATVNQEERKRISIRTKEALAAKKARGEKPGNPRLDEFRNTDTTNARQAKIEKSIAFKDRVKAVIQSEFPESMNYSKPR